MSRLLLEVLARTLEVEPPSQVRQIPHSILYFLPDTKVWILRGCGQARPRSFLYMTIQFKGFASSTILLDDYPA